MGSISTILVTENDMTPARGVPNGGVVGVLRLRSRDVNLRDRGHSLGAVI